MAPSFYTNPSSLSKLSTDVPSYQSSNFPTTPSGIPSFHIISDNNSHQNEVGIITVSYTYEIVVYISANVTLISEEVEREVLANLTNIANSPKNGRRFLASSLRAQLNVEISRRDATLQNDINLMDTNRFNLVCKELNVTNESTSICYTVTASLQFRPTRENYLEEAEILKRIKISMDSIDKREDGLLDLLFLSGEIGHYEYDDSLISTSIEKEHGASETSKKSAAGGIIIATGVVILLLVPVLMIWRKKKGHRKGMEHEFLDDDSLESNLPNKIGDNSHGTASDKGTDSLSETATIIEYQQ